MLIGSSTLVSLGSWLTADWGISQYSANLAGVSESRHFDNKLPNITIFATGGTIAGASLNHHDTSTYQIGSLGFQNLIDSVPNLTTISNVKGVQIANVGSHDIRTELLIHMAQQIQQELDSPLTQGVVVTHGTDTLEETAFFIDLTVKSEKPVVVVGAMRPATTISADGPMNLLHAIALAASASARNRGVMIAMNDRIGSARFTTKTNANRVDAFRAVEQGFLGVFVDASPIFFYPPSRPLGHHHFNISHKTPDSGLPKVDILYGHQELEAGLFKSAVELGARGIVLAGVGGGWWPTIAMAEIKQVAMEHGVFLMMSRRPQDGYVDGAGSGSLGCGFLDPSRCRIQLQLCFDLGLGKNKIERIFQSLSSIDELL